MYRFIERFLKGNTNAFVVNVIAGMVVVVILYWIKVITLPWLLFTVTLVGALCILINYMWFRRVIGIRQLWPPNSRNRLRYYLAEATERYIVMGVTLHSMLQITGIGVDLERFAVTMPKQLRIQLLLLHPDSPFFAERVRAAHPNHPNLTTVIEQKRCSQLDFIERVRTCLCGNVNIRFYNSFPAWWIQYIDNKTIHMATQTRNSHIGQTFPLGLTLKKEDDSLLFWTVSEMIESVWEKALPLNPNGTLPLLEGPVRI
jgi:hypothetical protein